MSRDVLSRRAEKALRGLFRESFRRMDDEQLEQFALWSEWLRGKVRDENPGGLDTMTDAQVEQYLREVERGLMQHAGGEV